MRKLVPIGMVVVGALGVVTGALAGGGYGGGYGGTSSTATQSTQSTSSKSAAGASTHSFKATLTSAAEVPKPKARAGAGGTFAARSTESGSKVTIHWVLKFHGLSGKAMAAHIHMGKKGVSGPVVVALCGPCKASQSGNAKITSTIENALEQGKAYVNVHTAKNAAGEIRGQVKLTGST